ncbi:hypothetical protein HK103_006378 [Boothiomyces macroporosus]|uniref:Uncharacterized protein n=1 Tax=Boothiomyces macroporosus TaxID=261099 RepID=A0AAD5UHJ9_9FUNG|nr:hypothetical protein HK103_006378 [Boothiomyces macroporosus]
MTLQFPERDCGNVPNSIYVYNIQSIKSKFPNKNETWPIGYIMQAKERAVGGNCRGTVKVPLSADCCATFLNPAHSVASASTMLVTPNNITAQMLSSVNTNNYCAVQSNSTIYGYSQVYYLANDLCSSESMTCSSNGSLKVFSGPNCTGKMEQFPLTSANQTLNSTILKNFTAVLINIQDGQGYISWTVFVPLSQLFPDFSYGIDIFNMVLYATSFICIISTIIYLGNEFYKKRTVYLMGLLSSQLLWLAWLSVRLMATFSVFTSAISGTLNTLEGIASLAAVLTSVSFLLYFLHCNRSTSIIVYFMVIVSHAVLAGGFYCRWGITLPEAIVSWGNLFPYWLITMFIVDCIPPIYVSFAINRIRAKSLSEQLFLVITSDVLFFMTLVFQLLVIALYISFDQLRDHSESLGSDRTWVAFIGVLSCCLAIHGVLNIVLIERLRHIISKTSAFTNTSQFKSTNSTAVGTTQIN